MPIGIFAFLAAFAVIAAGGVILQRNPIHCVLALALVLADLGVLFMGLGAVTLGFLQILVYVGAIMVLFLFVIWLLNIQADPAMGGALWLKLGGSLVAAAIAAELGAIFLHASKLGELQTPMPAFGTVEALARMLFSDYLIAFEVTSVLLLAAIVGAIALARSTGPALRLARPGPAREVEAPASDPTTRRERVSG